MRTGWHSVIRSTIAPWYLTRPARRSSGVAGEAATRGLSGGRQLDEPLEARVVAERIELRLDARPCGGEGALVGERTFEIRERRFESPRMAWTPAA